MPPEELTIEIPGLRLAALAFGPPDGRRALALHGWLDNAASFARLAPLLPGWRLVALDLPGHGLSQHKPQNDGYHFADWVVDAAAAASALGWERFALLGHSMGAAVASLFAGALPERVERLVLIEALGPGVCPAEEAPARLANSIAQRTRVARAPRGFPDLATALERLRQVNTSLSPEGARLLVERGTRPAEGGGITWRADPRVRDLEPWRITEEHVSAFLTRIAAPTLVVRALQGMAFDEEMMRRRFGLLAGAELVELEGGHHVHLDHPERLARVLAPWMAGERAGGPPPLASRPEAQVRLVALDVDGVLTDGGLIYGADGQEAKQFDVKDGLGIRHLIEAGLEVAIITGRTSPAVDHRARDLGIAHVRQGVKDKLATLHELLEARGLSLGQVAYMGDDAPDLSVLAAVGFAAAPADARPEARRLARLVTRARGGRGAVRELAEHILRAQGKSPPP